MLVDLVATACDAVVLHSQRSAATAACVVAVLVPYLTVMSLSLGVQREAEISVQYGADLYVSATEFGRPASVPLASREILGALDGVEAVVPRIVGPINLGRDRHETVVVGVPREHLPQEVHCVQGRVFREDFEFVVGSQLARRLSLELDDRVLPFYRSTQGERTGKVVGVFRSDASLWEANVLFTSLETAAAIFDRSGRVTDFAVFCRPGYADAVQDRILQAATFPSASAPPLRARVVSQSELRADLPSGAWRRAGIFNLHFVLAFAVAILAVLVTSGVGLTERQREIAILKVLGWDTDALLLRALVESFLLCAASAAASVLIAYIWLKWLRGYWIAGVFLEGRGSSFDGPAPFAMTPWPVLLSFVAAFAVVMCGSLYATWRAAAASPRWAAR